MKALAFSKEKFCAIINKIFSLIAFAKLQVEVWEQEKEPQKRPLVFNQL